MSESKTKWGKLKKSAERNELKNQNRENIKIFYGNMWFRKRNKTKPCNREKRCTTPVKIYFLLITKTVPYGEMGKKYVEIFGKNGKIREITVPETPKKWVKIKFFFTNIGLKEDGSWPKNQFS